MCSSYSDTQDGLDPMWLRYSKLPDGPVLETFRYMLGDVVIAGDVSVLVDSAQVSQLLAAQEELACGLSRMLATDIPVSCCALEAAPEEGSSGRLTLSVGPHAELGDEGFKIEAAAGSWAIKASTGSGALYGVFRFLAQVQAQNGISETSSKPATDLRLWNMWDNLDGTIERGYAGPSFLWPMALWDPERLPEPALPYIVPCNSSDLYQRWEDEPFFPPGRWTPWVNSGAGRCMDNGAWGLTASQDGVCTKFTFDDKMQQLWTVADQRSCLDLDHGSGPNVKLYACHSQSHRDVAHQQFRFNRSDSTLRPILLPDRCVALRRRSPPVDGGADVDLASRVRGMLRMLKSVGVNGVSILNVNSCHANAQLVSSLWFQNVSRNLREEFRRYAITPFLSVCYANPMIFDNVSADPLSEDAQRWWWDKVSELYAIWPELGGLMVKADSEGNVGPEAYNRTEADGANLLARAVRPHGGIVLWRAFVYGSGPVGQEDRAKQPYDTFMPLDGLFDENVVVQIKNGPQDFQVREPVSPLLGSLRHTNFVMEVQATQEYTGQQIHAMSLVEMWKTYLDFDTRGGAEEGTTGTTIAERLSGHSLRGMAAVSNLGSMRNWTAHVLAGVNVFGFGRLAWEPTTSPESVHREWALLTFPDGGNPSNGRPPVVDVVAGILRRTWEVFEGYTSPLGIGIICQAGNISGDCAPPTPGPGLGPGGAECPAGPWPSGSDHYWMDPCVNYGFSNYSNFGLGCDRSSRGTGYTSQYASVLRDMYDDPGSCPLELLLFFHNVPWTHPLHLADGRTVELHEYIRERHQWAVGEVGKMAEEWRSLQGLVDTARFDGVVARFAQQLNDARVFSDTILRYFDSLAGPGAVVV